MKPQPTTEGTVDGVKAKPNGDAASRTAQRAQPVKTSPARAKENLGPQPWGQALGRGKKGKR